jgi:Transposase
MAIVGGLDIHRRQITYDWIDTDTGQARHGRIQPATRVELRAWLARLAGQQADFAFEGTTGWRFVAEEVMGAGFRAHLAEPADTRALRGPKRRAKTDRADARHLRDLLLRGALPESWIPPAHVADLRAQVRLRKALMDQRTAWHQRIHAVLYHHGLPERSWLLADEGRAWLARLELPTVARQTVDLALRTIDFLDTELDQLDATLARIARCQPGCRALMGRYGIGWPGRGEHLGRVRRRPPVRQLPPSRPVHRAGHHHLGVGRQARPWPPRPPRPTRAALGVARGGHVRRPPKLTRLRLLPTGPNAAGRQAGRPLGRPQARPRGLPRPGQARRSGTGAGRAPTGRLTPRPPGAPWLHRSADVVRPAPGCSCRHALVVDGPHRTSGRTRTAGTRSSIMSPEHAPGTEIRLDARAP